MKKPSRYPALKKVEGKIICRGCGSDIPKGRQTWCSKACYQSRCPQVVNFNAFQRDGGKCQMCGIETLTARMKRWWLNGETVAQQSARRKLEHDRSAEFDHIKPHSEGGEHVLENIRTLCRLCHKKRTAEWRALKAAEKRAAKIIA